MRLPPQTPVADRRTALASHAGPISAGAVFPAGIPVCERGYKVDGNQCAKIVCAEGAFLNDDNKCEKRREKKQVATRDRPEARLVPEARQAIGRRSEKSRPGMSSTGRPLTGLERAQGCYSNEAIMSGECP